MGDYADKADKSLERREHMPFDDNMEVAKAMSGIVERFSGASTTEQLGLFEQIIQAGIANGTTDRIHADQWAEDLFKTYGIIIRASDLRSGGTTPATGGGTGGGVYDSSGNYIGE